MTKNTMTIARDALASIANRTAEQEEAYQAICAELAKNAEKAAANRALYAEAHDVVIGVMSTEQGMTIAEIVTACGDNLPEGFSKSKVQYALLNYWAGEVVKIDNGKGALNTYRLA